MEDGGPVEDAAAGAAHHCDAGVVAAEQEEIVPFGPNYFNQIPLSKQRLHVQKDS